MTCATYKELLETWNWRPIRNCPGRYVLTGTNGKIQLEDIVSLRVAPLDIKTDLAKDLVVVVRLDEGGLISYRRNDGSILHTLNNPQGFVRKLEQLGIDVKKQVHVIDVNR